MDLVLDFNVDPDVPEGWKRVTAAQAKVMKQKITATNGQSSLLTNDELGLLLDLA